MSDSVTSLTFLGAAGTVTGSKYLLTVGGRRLMVDAGMFQGERQWRRRNWDEFPVPPDTITDILLTHAHLDHCGYLPALVAAGYAGPIWCTRGTKELAAIVLRDAAYLAEREASDAASGGWSKHEPPLPIYTLDDVERTIPLMTPVQYDAELDLDDGITARFTRAGHILGSSSVRVTTPTTSVLFSGDLGRHDHPVLRFRDTPPGADTVVVESTYGDREHPDPVNLPHEALADAIRRTVQRGGSVLIPAFAIDRTEIVLRVLKELREAGRIPAVPVFVNSPMASAALAVYGAEPDELRPDVDPREFAAMPDLHIIGSAQESMEFTSHTRSRQIVVTSSGMATGGRVLHHLKRMLPDPHNAVVLTGYQGVGTRGRSLMEGAQHVKIQGAYVPVRAEIVQDPEFSVHADASDLDDWLLALTPAPRTVYVTHGEQGSSEAMAERIRKELAATVVVPAYGERVLLQPGAEAPAAPVVAPSPGVVPGAPVSFEGRVVVDGNPVTGEVTSDLHVRSADAHRIVLEGTLTVDLD